MARPTNVYSLKTWHKNIIEEWEAQDLVEHHGESSQRKVEEEPSAAPRRLRSSAKDKFLPDLHLNKTITIFHGEATTLQVDCLVYPTNIPLGGVAMNEDPLFRAAGPELAEAVKKAVGNCKDPGAVRITKGFNLPAKFIIHTTPLRKVDETFSNCYKKCFRLAMDNHLDTIALPCLKTGEDRYPNEEGPRFMLRAVRQFLQDKRNLFKRVVFYSPDEIGIKAFEKFLPQYFPAPPKPTARNLCISRSATRGTRKRPYSTYKCTTDVTDPFHF